jgi:hypothetical protein
MSDAYEDVGRYVIHTWQFGQGWQCAVRVPTPQGPKPEAHFCMDMSPTEKIANQKGHRFIERYEEGLFFQTAEEEFLSSCQRYPTLFKRRERWLEHSFGTIGNGIDWIDGALYASQSYNMSIFDEERFPPVQEQEALQSSSRDEVEEPGRDFLELLSTLDDDPSSSARTIARQLREIRVGLLQEEHGPYPLPDTEGPKWLYPLSENYSNLFFVPDDVEDSWLKAAWDAVVMYATRAIQGNNRRLARGVLHSLHDRFEVRLLSLGAELPELIDDDYSDWPDPEKRGF